MKEKRWAWNLAVAVVLVCLIKIAFFSNRTGNVDLVPSAHADGGIIEWNNSLRIVTSGNDGAATYVWDYQGKTTVRKYLLEKGKLTLSVYTLDGESEITPPKEKK
ncbi:MAG: hypothetical protein V1913_04995 [Fibrobacterota bacterium]